MKNINLKTHLRLILIVSLCLFSFPQRTAAISELDTDIDVSSPPEMAIRQIDDIPMIFINDVFIPEGNESTSEAVFTVSLSATYTETVEISYATMNGTAIEPTDYITASGVLTFPTDTISRPITVTIQGDYIDEADEMFTLNLSNPVNGEISDGIGEGTITDDDTAVITIVPTSGLTTTETGGLATFATILGSEPTDDVTINLSSSNVDEGTVEPISVTFTPSDWSITQTITITGVDDFSVDGDIGYSIVTGAGVSGDSNYSGLDPDDVSVTNLDNDIASVDVTPTTGLVTTEGGGTATFSVTLTSLPEASVLIFLSSSDPEEGTVAPTLMEFTPSTWNETQTATLTGGDDMIADGPQDYTATLNSSSADGNYDALAIPSVSVTNSDNDSAGITVNPTGGLITSELGGTARFSIVLNTQPTANVTIGLSSSEEGEGTINMSSVTFTTLTYDIPITVTITGVDDDVDDENVNYTIITDPATSTDPDYSGLDPVDVAVTNQDNDTAGLTITPDSGLITSESGGSATFDVVLDSEPTSVVTITMSSQDPGEGTVSPSELVFLPTDWDSPQSVTITGVDDTEIDGDQSYTIEFLSTSNDTNYNLGPVNVSATNNDNDSAVILIDPITGLITTEGGGTDIFSVVLENAPTAAVTISLHSSDISEGTVLPDEMVFTPDDWEIHQTATVTGVDDAIDDGDVQYTIITGAAISSDSNYSGVNPDDVQVTNSNDDATGINVTPVSGLITTEAGGEDTFTIVLESQPTGDVTIPLSVSDLDEGSVSPEEVNFTSGNWDTSQTVTVTGVDDPLDDGDKTFAVITGDAISDDANFAGINAPDVSVTNLDDDSSPVAVADSYITNATSTRPLTVTMPGVLANDSDADGDSLEALFVGNQPLNGSVSLNSDGSFVYTPNADFPSGNDIFDYRASDGVNASTAVSVMIIVDSILPTVNWLGPVDNEMTLFVTGETVMLEASVIENHELDYVRFRRWDALAPPSGEFIQLALLGGPPYRVLLDTSTLNFGFNQILVDAFDTAGNRAQWKYIWIFREAEIFFPTISK